MGTPPTAVVDSAAGWVAGVSSILLSNPLEVWKIRQQVGIDHIGIGSTSHQGLDNAYKADNVIKNRLAFLSQMRSVVQREGIGVLTKGAAAPVAGFALLDALYFSLYGYSMDRLHEPRERPHNYVNLFAAAGLSGSVVALLESPIELIKSRTQVDARLESSSSFQIIKHVYRTAGLQGFFAGAFVSVIQAGLGSGVFFTLYHQARSIMHNDSTLGTFFASGTAAVLSAFTVYPLDIVGARIQTASDLSRPPRARHVVHHVWEMGVASTLPQKMATKTKLSLFDKFLVSQAFYRGILPSTISVFIAAATEMSVYEYVRETLS